MVLLVDFEHETFILAPRYLQGYLYCCHFYCLAIYGVPLGTPESKPNFLHLRYHSIQGFRLQSLKLLFLSSSFFLPFLQLNNHTYAEFITSISVHCSAILQVLLFFKRGLQWALLCYHEN